MQAQPTKTLEQFNKYHFTVAPAEWPTEYNMQKLESQISDLNFGLFSPIFIYGLVLLTFVPQEQESSHI